MDRSIHRSSRARPPPHRAWLATWPSRHATRTCRPVACTTSHTSCPITASSVEANGADRSQPRDLRQAGPAVGPGSELRCSQPEQRSPRATRQRSVEAADEVQRWLRTIEDPWLHVRGEAILGELARLQHRFDDAVLHLGRAAERSRQLGFQQTEAYQLTNLGRAQCQAGDYVTGAATLQLAIDKAQATGDMRLAALARVHLGRVLTCARTARAGAGSPRGRDRVAPRRRRGRAGRARRVPAGSHGRRGSRTERGGTPRGDPR